MKLNGIMLHCKKESIGLPEADCIDIIVCRTLHDAIPMSVYKTVQTGANILLGGVNDGNGIVVYQVCVDFTTKGVPLAPPSTDVKTHTIGTIEDA